MALFAPNVNRTMLTDLQPSFGGTTLGETVGEGFMLEGPGATSAPMVFGAGHPLVWLTTIVGSFLLLGFVAQKLGRGEQYANTKVSAVTVVVSGASAVLFIYVFKLLAFSIMSRSGANGFTTFALAI